jgi:hypothetical protein
MDHSRERARTSVRIDDLTETRRKSVWFIGERIFTVLEHANECSAVGMK